MELYDEQERRDIYDAVWQRGVLSSPFFSKWMSSVGVMSGVSDHFWRSRGMSFARKAPNTPTVHRWMAHVTGDTAAKVLGLLEHARDAWWDERDVRPTRLLGTGRGDPH